MCVYLRATFKVSSIILTSFRQGTPPPTSKQNRKKPTRLKLALFLSLYCNSYKTKNNKYPGTSNDTLKEFIKQNNSKECLKP